jgi:hypothetical protein
VTYMTRQSGKGLAQLVVIGMAVQLLVIGYVFYQSYQGRNDVVSSQRQGCERGKLDRQDNADFQIAQTIYITGVTDAQSVREDVKQAARKAVITFHRTSQSLKKRARIDCAHVYPKAGLLP